MEPIKFRNAYYIKLGKKGQWEESSIREDKVRIGWRQQTLEDINRKDWAKIGRELRSKAKTKGNATHDLNMLKMFVESTSDDVWITFHDSCLWWCRLEESNVDQDEISKYRRAKGKWCDQDISGKILVTEEIPGSLAQTQGYRSTVCKVRNAHVLGRLLNDQRSPAYQEISKAKEDLIAKVQPGLGGLHWKNFETLVELLYGKAGWHRISRVGETMKYADIVFEEPITRDLYQVQVKSAANVAEFKQYAEQFSPRGFRRLYFVVHSPDRDLRDYKPETYEKNVELVLPERLAQMVVDLGLTDWLLKKIK